MAKNFTLPADLCQQQLDLMGRYASSLYSLRVVAIICERRAKGLLRNDPADLSPMVYRDLWRACNF